MTVSETLQHAKVRFECLAEEFDKAGDTASWAMCSTDAEMMERALTAALSDQAGGPTGTIRKMGWMPDDTGRVFFGAVVEYENGPPDLPIKIAWDKTPVCIVIAPPPSSTAGEEISYD